MYVPQVAREPGTDRIWIGIWWGEGSGKENGDKRDEEEGDVDSDDSCFGSRPLCGIMETAGEAKVG